MKNEITKHAPQTEELAHGMAADLIRLIFLRVGKDSPAGFALRRALGFSTPMSAEVLTELGVSSRSLRRIQSRLEGQLGALAFVASATNQSERRVSNRSGQKKIRTREMGV